MTVFPRGIWVLKGYISGIVWGGGSGYAVPGIELLVHIRHIVL